MQKKLSVNLQATNYPDHRIDLYRQAAKDLAASNSGLERYVVGLFGPELIGSLALAFDPYAQFNNNPRRVSTLEDGPKIVRERPINTIPRANRKEMWKRTVRVESYHVGQGLFDYVYTGPDDVVTSGTINRGDQPSVYGIIRDTTRRTRPIEHDDGEFELFAPKMLSSSRSFSFQQSDYRTTLGIGTSEQRQRFVTRTDSKVVGPEFICTQASVDSFLAGTRARALTVMSERVLGMLNRVEPSHRTFSLAREVAELKDLPQTLQSTLHLWLQFERSVGRTFFRTLQHDARSWRNSGLLQRYADDLGELTRFNYNHDAPLAQSAGSAFLTFKFGWQTMVRSIVQMLPSPGQVTKRVNALVNAIGEDRSFRTHNVWEEPMTSFPDMSTWLLKEEGIDWSSVPLLSNLMAGTRKVEVRLMANFNIRFPQLDIPRLRVELFDRLMGVYPSPGDLYDLIPWTWLIDYFNGIGDYVHLMDSIHSDKSLINYGFITYREEGNVTATFRGLFQSLVSRQADYNLVQWYNNYRFLHDGRFSYVYQLRKTIPYFANVKTYWDSGTLDPNQRAIIGSLLASRHGTAPRRGV